jgi:hypothetical protein
MFNSSRSISRYIEGIKKEPFARLFLHAAKKNLRLYYIAIIDILALFVKIRSCILSLISSKDYCTGNFIPILHQ